MKGAEMSYLGTLLQEQTGITKCDKHILRYNDELRYLLKLRKETFTLSQKIPKHSFICLIFKRQLTLFDICSAMRTVLRIA